jgi:uroporphyrinogen decarboxylase
MLGDDVAMQTGMLISPQLWRIWLKPRMVRIINAAKSIHPRIHIFYHSDGNPSAIIDELIEIGVTVLNPIQPECMNPAEVKKKYGDRLAFWGTMGVQSTLPFGTPEDVRAEVKLRMQTIGSGGGLLLGPSHMIEPEVPWENIIAFFNAVEEYGYYR